MTRLSPKFVPRQVADETVPIGPRIGHIVSVDRPDAIRVDFQGNPHGPVPARSTVEILETYENRKVVLVFENGDFRRPVIIGLIQDHPVAGRSDALTELNRKEIIDILVDGEKLVVDAKKTIEIRCGKSSLMLNPDGKVILKGEQITTRARGTNKVKGAAVRIN